MTFRVDARSPSSLSAIDGASGEVKKPDADGWFKGARTPIEAAPQEEAETMLSNEVARAKMYGLLPDDLETRLVAV